MHFELYVIDEDDATKPVIVLSDGSVVVPMTVDGYACIKDRVCSTLVIGIKLNTYEDIKKAVYEMVDRKNKARSNSIAERLIACGITKEEIEMINKRYAHTTNTTKVNNSKKIKVCAVSMWDSFAEIYNSAV